jgi:hypothetical protein
MSRLGLKQILGSLLVCILFAPVVLATGSASFRWGVYHTLVMGVPLFPVMVVALLLVLMVLVWIFSSTAFSAPEAQSAEVQGGEQ